jgi:hypothetical protein
MRVGLGSSGETANNSTLASIYSAGDAIALGSRRRDCGHGGDIPPQAATGNQAHSDAGKTGNGARLRHHRDDGRGCLCAVLQ